MTEASCHHCKSTYLVDRYRAAKSKFCSYDCYWENRIKAFAVRFWEHVQKSEECWIWTGSISAYGYGLTCRNSKTERAHRMAYELTYGQIPEGTLVLHKCDNRACVRPDHLFLGTQSDNIKDMDNKGRRPKPHPNSGKHGNHCWAKRFPEKVLRGESNPRAVLCANDVRVVREMLARGESKTRIAKTFGVTRGAIGSIYYGRTWAHIT